MSEHNFFIKLNLHCDAKIICIESNDCEFLFFLKSLFYSHLFDFEDKINVDVTVSVEFGLPLMDFTELSKSFDSVRCGLLASSSCDSTKLQLFGLFKSKELYKAAFREIRDHLDTFIINNNVMTLHASCVSDSRGAICIIGDKFSGKTTLMLKLLSLNYNFVSNDKPYIYKSEGEFYVLSLPVSAGIRYGSLDILPYLKDNIQKYSSSDEVEFSTQGRVHLSPKIICDIFNTSYCNHSSVRKFIYLETNYKNDKHLVFSSAKLDENILSCKDLTLRDYFLDAEIKVCSSYEEALSEAIC
nr:kinase [Enterobacter sp.]